jgi:hypothetical protein
MYQQSIMEEADKYKDSSRFKIKKMILIYKFLRFCNSNTYYFMVSLSSILIPLFIFNFSVGIIFMGMIVHYVLFMKFLKGTIDKFFQTEREIKEIDDVIELLKNHLKNKNPN